MTTAPCQCTAKTCNRCKQNKPLDAYHKNKTTKDGLQNTCKTCKAELDKGKYDTVKARNRRLKERYNISTEVYEHMYLLQNGACKICLKIFPQLVVDHCHNSGTVRGLLCHSCNIMLGMAKDNVSNLSNAISYLSEHVGDAWASATRTIE